jgi:hypothetical protein
MSPTLDRFWSRLKHARNAPRIREKIFVEAGRENGNGFERSLRAEWEIWEADRRLRDQVKSIQANSRRPAR